MDFGVVVSLGIFFILRSKSLLNKITCKKLRLSIHRILHYSCLWTLRCARSLTERERMFQQQKHFTSGAEVNKFRECFHSLHLSSNHDIVFLFQNAL